MDITSKLRNMEIDGKLLIASPDSRISLAIQRTGLRSAGTYIVDISAVNTDLERKSRAELCHLVEEKKAAHYIRTHDGSEQLGLVYNSQLTLAATLESLSDFAELHRLEEKPATELADVHVRQAARLQRGFHGSE